MTTLAAKSWPYLICKVLTLGPDGLLADMCPHAL